MVILKAEVENIRQKTQDIEEEKINLVQIWEMSSSAILMPCLSILILKESFRSNSEKLNFFEDEMLN